MTRGGSTTVLRARHLIAEHLAVAVVVCLLLAGAGGFVAYEEYTAPDTTTEQREVGTWTTDSAFAHQATVQRSTRAFEAGTVLENRSAYLFSVAPELTATHVFSHGGDAGPATVATNATLVARSVGETDDGSVEYWRVSERLDRSRTRVQPGASRRFTTTVNVSEQRNLTSRIESELGGTPGRIQVFLLVTTRAEAELAGETRTATRTDRLSLDPQSGAYAVSANATGQRTAATVSETVTVPVESNPARVYGGALFALLWLGVAGLLVYADREDRLAVPEETVSDIEARRSRETFDEWISVGTVPEPSEGDRRVEMASLTDLVDVAIDSERRVIEDADADRFVVIDGRTWYCYEPAAGGIAAESEADVDAATDASDAGTPTDGDASGAVAASEDGAQ